MRSMNSRGSSPLAGRRLGALLAAIAMASVPLLLRAQSAPPPAGPPPPQELYEAAQAADRAARQLILEAPGKADTLAALRAAVQKYRLVVIAHPTSGYCDDALWHGGVLSTEAFTRFGQDRDRRMAVSLLKLLKSGYPLSAFAGRVQPRLDRLEPRPVDTASSPAPASGAGTVEKPPTPPQAPRTPTSAASTVPSGMPTPVAGKGAGSSTRPAPGGPAPPATPSANTRGGYSLARQLGLRVGRVVIDPGHGGQDPGALGPGMSESAITLDIALRLEAILTEGSPLSVVLTRRTDTYVGLQERTAIANRESADLFVSIHVNANTDPNIRGIETFLLNFASTPGAAAVAARENASSTMNMGQLNDVVRQIATASKLDESQDLARQVQASMVKRLKVTDRGLKDFGIKQAPFVVLLGASMPSVLVEVAFLTNRQEEQLLYTGAYRQQIAESLGDGIGRYLRTLKKNNGIAGQSAEKAPVRVP